MKYRLLTCQLLFMSSVLGTSIIEEDQIPDIRPLATLTTLTALDLSGNKITNVESLAALTNLTSFDLDRNTRVDSLATLTTLTTFDVGGLESLE